MTHQSSGAADAEVTLHDHVRGGPGARITLIEYVDYQCPHCGEAYWRLKRLQRQYGDNLRLVVRNFPLTAIHPLAEPAAETAEFAGHNGRFWEMHDAIFEHQRRLSLEMLTEVGEGLSLDPTALRAAVAEHGFETKIQNDFRTGVSNGVHGTPTFFLNGRRLNHTEELEPTVYDALMRRAA